MAVNLSPVGGVAAQFFDNSGNVLTGGKLHTYLAGTTTPAITYTTNAGNIPQSNPIILNASGRVPGSGEIWLTDGILYKFVLTDSNDVLIATYDNITGINSNFVNFTNQQEIQTATAGQTVFNLTTTSYQPGTNSLSVFVDGVNQYGPGAQYAYTETDSDTVTFVNGLHVGALVKFTTSQLNSNASGVDAEQVSYTPPFTGSVSTNVEAKLAQTVSVTDFGAVGDGIVDDTAAIQAAIDSGAVSIQWPEGTYRFTQFGTGIFQEHHALGAVTLLTSVASGNAIEVSNEYGVIPPLLPNGFYRQELFEGPFQIYNDNPSSTATGIYFGDAPPDVTYSAPNMHVNGLVINKFLVSHAFGNNAYIIQFDNCTFYSRSVGLASSKGILVDQVLTNSGGLINYDNCIFQGFENAIYINLSGFEIVFNKCSFDVCTNCLANLANDSVLRFTDCRWEWDGDTEQFNVLGNAVGCSVFVDQPYIQFNGTGTSPANPAFAAIGSAGFMSIRSGVWRDAGTGPAAWCSVNGAGTLIYDPTYKTLGAGATVFANLVGAGIGSGTLREYLDTKAFNIPISNSSLTIRWGNISVASPGIAANAITDVDVTWTGALTTVLAAFAQVYPTTSTTVNDFSGVVTSIPISGTSHRFGIKNGPVAQGATGQFLILGYE